jgi:hypothetical protein
MTASPNRVPSTRRRALLMLAGSPDGLTEPVLLLHGFTTGLIAAFIDDGLAQPTKDGRIRITDRGLQACPPPILTRRETTSLMARMRRVWRPGAKRKVACWLYLTDDELDRLRLEAARRRMFVGGLMARVVHALVGGDIRWWAMVV